MEIAQLQITEAAVSLKAELEKWLQRGFETQSAAEETR